MRKIPLSHYSAISSDINHIITTVFLPSRRTAANRPDLLARLASRNDALDTLDARDRQALSDAGFPLSGQDMAH